MFSLAPVFSDHAVLQRNRFVPVWGTFSDIDGENLFLSAALLAYGESELEQEAYEQMIPLHQACSADAGRWEVSLAPQPAGGPYELIVSLYTPAVDKPLAVCRISDIWFGDVYLFAGQSNIDFRLSCDGEYMNGSLNHLDYPQIRSFRAPRIDYKGAEPENNSLNNTWSILSDGTAGDFPAVAFYFAVSMFEHSRVPIGCLDVSRGGTSAAVWVDESCLRDDPDLRIYLDEYSELLSHLDVEKNKRDHNAYYENLAVYNTEAARYAAMDGSAGQIEKIIGPFPWPPPAGPFAYRSPCGLFHTMMEPIIPFGISGVIFYQGEEDVSRFHLYKKLLRTLVEYWRLRWYSPALPFLLVQIAPYDDPLEPDLNAALLREAQIEAADEMSSVTLVVTTDCGEPDDIHPKSKRMIGERLFKKACRYILEEDISSDGPYMMTVDLNGDTARVAFAANGSPLQIGLTGNDKKLTGFMIAASDGVFYPADAHILGDQVRLTSPSVPMPRYVRYAFGKYVPSNLYNAEGLPAVPFRTDRMRKNNHSGSPEK